MSRAVFAIGLLISTAMHVWLLRMPAPPSQESLSVAEVVEVVETALGRTDKPQPEPQALPPPADEQAAPDRPAPGPHQPLVRMAEPPQSPEPSAGDLTGADEGRRVPGLRINWGTDEEAAAVLAAGGMKVVVLNWKDPEPAFTHLVEQDGRTWRRQLWRISTGESYSNRLRIVEDVPAFNEVRGAAQLGADERLAVLVPTRVERMLDAAQLRAAFERGLLMEEVRDFGGQFNLEDGTLAFDVTDVALRTQPGEPG